MDPHLDEDWLGIYLDDDEDESRAKVVGTYRGQFRWVAVRADGGSGWRTEFEPPLDLPPRSEAKVDLPPPGSFEGWVAVEFEFHAIPEG